MELRESVETRRSIRKFKKDFVSVESIQEIVETALFAPSWKNTQVTRYYAITNREVKEQLVQAMPGFNQEATETAPVIIVSTMIRGRSGYKRDGEFDSPKGKGWQMYDCGLSNMLLCLAANELGLGTVIMGLYDEDAISQLLRIPETEELASVIALGYPDETPQMPRRKSINEVLTIIE